MPRAQRSRSGLPCAQNRYLSAEGTWARPAAACEKGCLLVAGPQAPQLMDTRYTELVILLLDHGPDGSAGVILNRPTGAVVDDLLGGGWQPSDDGGGMLGAAFGGERVFLGGFFPPSRIARQPVTFLHGQVSRGRQPLAYGPECVCGCIRRR